MLCDLTHISRAKKDGRIRVFKSTYANVVKARNNYPIFRWQTNYPSKSFINTSMKRQLMVFYIKKYTKSCFCHGNLIVTSSLATYRSFPQLGNDQHSKNANLSFSSFAFALSYSRRIYDRDRPYHERYIEIFNKILPSEIQRMPDFYDDISLSGKHKSCIITITTP